MVVDCLFLAHLTLAGERHDDVRGRESGRAQNQNDERTHAVPYQLFSAQAGIPLIRTCVRPSMKRIAGLFLLAACAANPVPPAAPPAQTAPQTQPAQFDSVARQEVNRLMREHNAHRAAVVILDRDGRIMGAAGAGPDGDEEVRRVSAVGSTIKPFTIAAALDAGLDPTLEFAGDALDLGDILVRDSHPRASLTARDVLITSSNVGAARIVTHVGEPPVEQVLDAMGVRVPNEASWALNGTGIGVEMSPLKLAGAYVAFVNEGVAVGASNDGTGVQTRLVSANAARLTLEMLEAAVGDEGTGHRARVPNARVAGKTGTVREGGAVFAGVVFEADAPRYVVVVRAEVEGGYGGSIAAPSFARVASNLAR